MRDELMEVREIANYLETSEFEVFRQAYQAWYREPAPIDVLERHFGPYLFNGATPFWVNQYTRQKLLETEAAARESRELALRRRLQFQLTLALAWRLLTPRWLHLQSRSARGAWF